MPTPHSDENRREFLDRCMGDDHAVSKFPDASQRYAVCNSIWDESSKGSDMKRQDVKLELKKEPDQDGVFEGYASVFGIVDQGMDVVARGAFAKSLGRRKVKMLWQHDMSQPIGVWDDIYEDERGLFVRGRIMMEVAKAREVMAAIYRPLNLIQTPMVFTNIETAEVTKYAGNVSSASLGAIT